MRLNRNSSCSILGDQRRKGFNLYGMLYFWLQKLLVCCYHERDVWSQSTRFLLCFSSKTYVVSIESVYNITNNHNLIFRRPSCWGWVWCNWQESVGYFRKCQVKRVHLIQQSTITIAFQHTTKYTDIFYLTFTVQPTFDLQTFLSINFFIFKGTVQPFKWWF